MSISASFVQNFIWNGMVQKLLQISMTNVIKFYNRDWNLLHKIKMQRDEGFPL